MKKSLSTLLLYFCTTISALSSPQTAPTTQVVTLEQCYAWAEENFPLIADKDLVEKSSEYTISNARHAWLPQIIFSAKATYQSDVAGFPESMTHIFQAAGVNIHPLNKDQYRVALDIQQTIWDGGVSKAKNHEAQAQKEVELCQIEVDLYALRDRINNLYFGILLLDEQINQANGFEQLLDSNVSRVQEAIDGGVAQECDLKIMQAELIKARQNKAKIIAAASAYRQMLSLITGHEITLLELPQETELVYAPENKRPELQFIEAKSKALEAQNKMIAASLTPRISLFAQGFYGNPGFNLFKDMTENAWTANGIVGIGLQWNISNFYNLKNNRGKIKVAQNRLNTQKEIFTYNINLKNAEQQNAVARMRAIIAEDVSLLELREQIREAYEAKVDCGVASVTDLLGKITDENHARIEALLHKIELLKYLYDNKLNNNN